jgi:PhzF family phenazine biosynthesis protein
VLRLDFRHVDVFSRRPLRGNGLVVVLDAGTLTAELMLELTRELRQFETAFVTSLDMAGRSATLRIFTEDEELDFAGHPVLGTAGVLHDLLTTPAELESWTIEVAGRRLAVQTAGAEAWVDASMDQGPADFGPAVSADLAAAYLDALGLMDEDSHPDLPMQVVSTGLPYLVVPLRSGLERAGIRGGGFVALLARSGAKFVYALDPDRPEGRTWDNAGRVEDVATGSAAGPAGAYLVHHGARRRGEPLIVHQGRFVGRQSTIDVRVGPAGNVFVGGPVASVAAGRFHARV